MLGSNAMALLAKPLSVRGWSERTVILLAMQARDVTLTVRWTGRRLTTEQVDTPAWLPVADRAVRIAAELIGGVAGEPRLPRAMTAHVLGGCCIGPVVDRFHRVLSEPGLHVVDGSAVNANLGVDPSLAIAAQAERALAPLAVARREETRPRSGA